MVQEPWNYGTQSRNTSSLCREADTEAPRFCLIHDLPLVDSPSFVQMRARSLPARVLSIYGVGSPYVGSAPVLDQSIQSRSIRKVSRTLLRRDWSWEQTVSYLKVFRRYRPQVVVAEFGGAGVRVREACVRSGIPLITIFHGHDVYSKASLHDHLDSYSLLFKDAAALVGVSRSMCSHLVSLKAPVSKVHWCACGVDCNAFHGATPSDAPPDFLSVGRFVEKKAPHFTILAFALVHDLVPESRLFMIGDGPLLSWCRDLAQGLQLDDAVVFLGNCSQSVIQSRMRSVRAFVQHSIIASDGDREGTPVAILEASSSGLPIISTRHEGIRDVVIEGITGLLVNERDVEGMSRQMIELAKSPDLARVMGLAGREYVVNHHSLSTSSNRLWSICQEHITKASHRGS